MDQPGTGQLKPTRQTNLQPNTQGMKFIEKLLLRKNLNREASNKSKDDEGSSSSTKLHILAKALQISNRGDPRDGVTGDRVLYARQNRSLKPQVFGGTPITKETAIKLRTIVFGTSLTSPRTEWLKTGIVLKEPVGDDAYCLESTRNTTRGLITVIQAEIVKRLIFKDIKVKGEASERFLKIDATEQVQVLIHVLSHILWRIGEKSKAVICLPQQESYFSHSTQYFQDGITEKLQLFEITDYEELQIVIKRYLYLFADDSSGGALLFLYSAVLTRGIERILQDLEGSKCQLVWKEEEGSMCIVTLLLTGRATPHLHNGVIYVGDEDHYAVPRFGILSRSEVGLLVYRGGDQVEDETGRPGSRLKTPSLPVWVTYTVGRYALMYNTNRELLNNYHAEKRFELTYISCGGQRARLTVDTRQGERESVWRTSEDTPLSTFTDIEKVIHTKWPDAHITWNESTL